MQALFSCDSDSDMELQSKPVECKPELVILSLQKFYNSRKDMDKIMPYLLGTAPISLRLIDWFVTNYCRKNFIGYKLNGQEFLVYVSYKSQLKAYSKQFFDPNCRRERIVFQINGYEPFRTTVGKLNFFRWAFETNILDYITEHYDDIQNDRTETNRISKRNNSTQSSTSTVASDASTASAVSAVSIASSHRSTTSSRTTQRRHRSKQIPSAIQHVQRHDVQICISFD
jgi:hypothetical protein